MSNVERGGDIEIFGEKAEHRVFEYAGMFSEHYAIPRVNFQDDAWMVQPHILNGKAKGELLAEEHAEWIGDMEPIFTRIIGKKKATISYNNPELSCGFEIDLPISQFDFINVSVLIPGENYAGNVKYGYSGGLASIISEAQDLSGYVKGFEDLFETYQGMKDEIDPNNQEDFDRMTSLLKKYQDIHMSNKTICVAGFIIPMISFFESAIEYNPLKPSEAYKQELGMVYPYFDDKYRLDYDETGSTYILHTERYSNELTSLYAPKQISENFYRDCLNTESQNWISYRDGMGIHAIRTKEAAGFEDGLF